MQNSTYLCLCYIRRPGNSVFIYTYMTFTSLLLEHHHLHRCSSRSVFFRGKELVSLRAVTVFKYREMWNSEEWISLLLFHKSRTTWVAETVHEIYVGIFFICKQVRHSDHPTALQSNTATTTSQGRVHQCHLALLARNSITVTTLQFIRLLCSKWHEHDLGVWPVCHGTPCIMQIFRSSKG